MRTAALSLLIALAASAALACGPTAVCVDTSSSVTGTVIIEGVRVSWSTDDESGVASYKVRRFTCNDPSTCSTLVTTVTPVASCGTNHDYEVIDTSPGDAIGWTVEIWAGAFTRTCAIDVEP